MERKSRQDGKLQRNERYVTNISNKWIGKRKKERKHKDCQNIT